MRLRGEDRQRLKRAESMVISATDHLTNDSDERDHVNWRCPPDPHPSSTSFHDI